MAVILTVQTTPESLVLKAKQEDDTLYATAKIIAGDNRIMVSNFAQEESEEAKEALRTFVKTLYEDFGGKICVLDAPSWLKPVLAEEGFAAESKAKAVNLRRTTPKDMRAHIEEVVFTDGAGWNSENINPSLFNSKLKDQFSLLYEKFKIISGEEVAARAEKVAALAKKSGFAQALIDRCLAAGAQGFQTKNAVALEDKSTGELAGYVCLDGHGDYGYFGNTFVDSEKFVGGGRQAGTALLYFSALGGEFGLGIFSQYPHLMVIDPPKRDAEFGAICGGERLSPTKDDILVKFDDPSGLRGRRLTPPFAPPDTRFHHALFESSHDEEPLADYLGRIDDRLAAQQAPASVADVAAPQPVVRPS